MQSLLIISATRYAQSEFIAHSHLGRSLKRFAFTPLISSNITFGCTTGLPHVYNAAISEENRNKILVFVHDDVRIDDWHLIVRLNDALSLFDVVGLAGNRRRLPNQPSWAFTGITNGNGTFQWDNQSNLYGAVAHFDGDADPISWYGSVQGDECKLLDGLFLAARCDTLLNANVRFDPRFTFHFYDLDFCRSCEKAGLRMGTWPIAVTHASVGSPSQQWQQAYLRYLSKWGN